MNISRLIQRLDCNLYLDYGKRDDCILIAGMGRGGTTWIADLINFDYSHRILFEPFQPEWVVKARPFELFQYMRPDDVDAERFQSAAALLGGKVRTNWVDCWDRERHRRLFKRRIVKDIRVNLMLKWLHNSFGTIPIVLVMRHPLAVANSWIKLGWGGTERRGKTNVDIVLAQQRLLEDFPRLAATADSCDLADRFERAIYEWGLLHYVPFLQLAKDEYFLLSYEDLLLNPLSELRRVLTFLQIPFDEKAIRSRLALPSSTNFLKRDYSGGGTEMLKPWDGVFNEKQAARANEILAQLGLADLYDAEGYRTNVEPSPIV